MSPEQKSSIFALAVCLITAAIYVVLLPFFGLVASTGAFGLLGLLGFQRLFYRKRRGSAEVLLDERDVGIARRSASSIGAVELPDDCDPLHGTVGRILLRAGFIGHHHSRSAAHRGGRRCDSVGRTFDRRARPLPQGIRGLSR